MLEHGETHDHQILQTLVKWKSVFSKKWFDKHFDQPEQGLVLMWKMLFSLAENNDPAISVAAFNAIGALLLSLSPFYSEYLINSFGAVVPELDVSSNISIAVISVFVFLSHLVAPHKINNYFESIMVLQFFGADLHSFIQFIPQLIMNTNQMNYEFHQRLMHSLLGSFGRNPNSHFIDSMISLLHRFPRRLMNNLLTFLNTNNLSSTLFAIGSKIIEHPSLFCYLTNAQNVTIFEEAKKIFNNISNASNLEQAVRVLYRFSKLDNDLGKDVIDFIDNKIFSDDYETKFPPHIKRNLIPLARKIQYILPQKEDSSNVISIKVQSLSNFIDDNCEQVIDIITQLVPRNDEVFSSISDFLAQHNSKLIQMSENKEKLAFIYDTLLSNTERNWVQQVAICSAIENSDQFEIIKFFPNYISKSIDFLINSSLSPQESLSEKARKAFLSFASKDNIERILITLFKCDFFDDNVSYKAILLLNALIEKVKSPQYSIFIGVYNEMIIDNPSHAFQSEILSFFSHFDLQSFPNASRINNICLNLMQYYYYSLTRNPLIQLPGLNERKDIPPFLKDVTTDIVANSSINLSDLLEPMHKCLKFLITTKEPIDHLIAPLLPLFPSDILTFLNRKFRALNKPGQIEPIPSAYNIDLLISEIIKIFDRSQDMSTIAKCVSFMLKFNKDSLKPLSKHLIAMIHAKQVQTSFVGSIFIRAIKAIAEGNEINCAFCLLSDLPEKEKNIFAIELTTFHFEPFGIKQPSFTQQFPFLLIAKQHESALEWLKVKPLKVWPVKNIAFYKYVISCLPNLGMKIVVNGFDLDEEHWKLIESNLEYFDISHLSSNYIKNRINIIPTNEVKYKHTPISILAPNILKYPTLSPLLNFGYYNFEEFFSNHHYSEYLIISFFRFSNVILSNDLFNKIVNDFSNQSNKEVAQRVIDSSIEYSKRFNTFKTNLDQLELNDIQKQHYSSKDIRKFILMATPEMPSDFYYRVVSLLAPNVSSFLQPKKIFYFVRFIRMCLSRIQKNFEGILSMALQSLDNMILAITHDNYFHDFLLKEIAMFLLHHVSIKRQSEFSEKYNIFSSFLASTTIQHIQSMIEFDIPSYQSLALHICNINLSLDPIPFFTNSISNRKIINIEYANFCFHHKKQVPNNIRTAYFKAIFKINSPFLSINPNMYDFLIYIMDPAPNIKLNLSDYSDFFKDVAKHHYSMPRAIEIIKYYYNMLKIDPDSSLSKKKCDRREVESVKMVFFADQTVKNCQKLASYLINQTPNLDAITLLIENLILFGNKFYIIFFLAIKVISNIDKKELGRFTELLQSSLRSFPFISRTESLLTYFQGPEKLISSFIYALAETNDLDNIKDLIQKVNNFSKIQKEELTASTDIHQNKETSNSSITEDKLEANEKEQTNEMNLEEENKSSNETENPESVGPPKTNIQQENEFINEKIDKGNVDPRNEKLNEENGKEDDIIKSVHEKEDQENQIFDGKEDEKNSEPQNDNLNEENISINEENDDEKSEPQNDNLNEENISMNEENDDDENKSINKVIKDDELKFNEHKEEIPENSNQRQIEFSNEVSNDNQEESLIDSSPFEENENCSGIY